MEPKIWLQMEERMIPKFLKNRLAITWGTEGRLQGEQVENCRTLVLDNLSLRVFNIKMAMLNKRLDRRTWSPESRGEERVEIEMWQFSKQKQ